MPLVTAVDARAEPIEDTLEVDIKSFNSYPLTWALTDLRTAALFLKAGGTPSTGNASYYNGDIPFAKVEDVVNAGMYLRKTGTFISLEGVNNSAAWVVEPETLLYTMYASYGVPTITKISVATNQAIIAISFNPSHVVNEFVVHYLWYVKPSLAKVVKGSTQPNLNAGIVSSLQFPLPPLEEQRRIVAKLEALFSKLEAGVTALQRARALLKRYRQSLLRDAVEGKLSADWRAKQIDLEPASVLLERVLRERREAWEARELAKLRAKGMEPLGNVWKARYEEPSAVDASSLPELPAGWVWATIGQISEVSGGAAVNASRAGLAVELPYLRVANVYTNELRLDQIKTIPLAESEVSRFLLKRGDLLVVEGNGSIEQIGRVAIWDGSIEPCVHQNHLIKARLHYIETGAYVIAWLMSPNGRQFIQLVASSTTGLHTLSISKVSSLGIALPSLEEQLFIVAELERRFELLDSLESTLESELKRAAQLRQSALHRAFTGRLVPQDPTAEPAATLLERIRSERSAAVKPPRAVAVANADANNQKAARGRPRKAQKQEELF